MSKKVCKNDKIVVDGDHCPICKENHFTTSFQGMISVIDPEKSEIAKVMGFKVKGDYAIKIR